MKVLVGDRALRPSLALPRIPFRWLADKIAAAEARARARDDLRRIDERLLADAGVSRADIDDELRHT